MPLCTLAICGNFSLCAVAFIVIPLEFMLNSDFVYCCLPKSAPLKYVMCVENPNEFSSVPKAEDRKLALFILLLLWVARRHCFLSFACFRHILSTHLVFDGQCSLSSDCAIKADSQTKS